MIRLTRVPQLNDIGNWVADYQHALNAHAAPYRTVKEDGIFGPKTLDLGAKLQAKYALHVDHPGIPGPRFLALLGLEVMPLVPIGPSTHVGPITSKVPGSNRHLHPTMRVLLEKALFPEGQVPTGCWTTGDIPEEACEVLDALLAMGIREVGGNNRGPAVGQIQSVIGSRTDTGNGDAWCESTWECVVAFIEDFHQRPSPTYASENVQDSFKETAKTPGMTTDTPEVGTEMAAAHQHSPGKGHAMPVRAKLSSGKLKTIEGNTGSGGIFSEIRDPKFNAPDLETMGFKRIYPNNKLA